MVPHVGFWPCSGLVVALGMAVGLWVPPSYVHIVVILICLTLQ